MRIVAGTHRGRHLTAPPSREVRPTGDRVRQGMFNILESHGLNYESTPVLDVFAGSGALAFEALSRGCPHAVLIDNRDQAVQTILKNSAHLGMNDRMRLLKRDALQVPLSPSPFKLAFLDPPYGKNLIKRTLPLLKERGWIEPGSVLVMEMGSRDPWEPLSSYEIWQDRTYGEARVLFATLL